MLADIRTEEMKERYIQSAYIGFQMGAGGEKNFGRYLESLGLADKPQQPQDSRTAKDILDGVEKTLQMMREKNK